MQQVFTAQMIQPNIKAAFTVSKLEGNIQRRVHAFDKKLNKIVSKVIEEPAGYLVKFAKGHSIRCKDVEHLKQIGAGYNLVPLVNTETGEITGAIQNLDSILDDAANV